MAQGYQLQIDACTDALVALLAARLPKEDSYAQPVDVRESGDDDFTDNQLTLKKTAVRVWFERAKYGAAKDISKTTLDASLLYQLPCRRESLRGGGESRSRSLQLATCVLAELAGARLNLANGTLTQPIAVLGVDRTRDGGGVVPNCYTVLIEVTGFAQFDGRNAKPTGGGQ